MEWLKLKDVTIGFIDKDIFYTRRKPEHFMRKYGGFGISSKILNELIRRGIQTVTFIYEGKKEHSKFTTTISKILELNITEYDYTFDFEDKQYFIPLGEMRKEVEKNV
jgi:hypothetical protein